MSNEIKEILREAKEYRYIDLNTEKTDLLLDYITNLQEEKDASDDYARHLHNENKKLQEENERLNKELMNKFETQQIMRDATGREYELILTRRVNLGEMYEDYKSRCEKAIPMLKELNKKLKDILNTGIDIAEITDIENILTGGDKE